MLESSQTPLTCPLTRSATLTACHLACVLVLSEKRSRREVKVCVGAVLAFTHQWMKAVALLIIERVLNNRSAFPSQDSF